MQQGKTERVSRWGKNRSCVSQSKSSWGLHCRVSRNQNSDLLSGNIAIMVLGKETLMSDNPGNTAKPQSEKACYLFVGQTTIWRWCSGAAVLHSPLIVTGPSCALSLAIMQAAKLPSGQNQTQAKTKTKAVQNPTKSLSFKKFSAAYLKYPKEIFFSFSVFSIHSSKKDLKKNVLLLLVLIIIILIQFD